MMANKHLSRSPSKLNSGLWYYEESQGIEVYDGEGLAGTITWRKIRNMLERKDKPNQPPEKEQDNEA